MQVVVVDTDISDLPGRTAFVGMDNVEGGRIAGEHIAEQLGGKGAVGIVNGSPGVTSVENRIEGAHEPFDAAGLEVVDELVAADWTRDNGVNAMEDSIPSGLSRCAGRGAVRSATCAEKRATPIPAYAGCAILSSWKDPVDRCVGGVLRYGAFFVQVTYFPAACEELRRLGRTACGAAMERRVAVSGQVAVLEVERLAS